MPAAGLSQVGQPFQQGGGGSIASSGSTLGEGVNAIGQQPYVQQTNAAAAQAANTYAQGQQALQTRGPQIINPSAPQSRQAIQGVQNNYGQVNAGLSNVMAGGGPNAGAATQQAGMDATIAQQMAAAHSGTGGQGGYSQAGAAAAQNQAAISNQATANAAAQARGAQISAAQSMAGQNYAQSGALALAQGQTQQLNAYQQAQLQQAQQRMDVSQAQNMDQLSLQEQGVGISAANDYLAQQQAAQQAAIKQQNQSSANTSSVVGDIGTGISDVMSIAKYL